MTKHPKRNITAYYLKTEVIDLSSGFKEHFEAAIMSIQTATRYLETF